MREPSDDVTLVLPFTPPPRGQLTIQCFLWVEILENIINLFGCIRFHHMDLMEADGVQLLLDVCAETLETFRSL